MLADTHAIRTLGSATSGHAADLAAVAATLSTLPGAAAAARLGPVAARFLTAFAGAAAEQSRAVNALGRTVSTAAGTAYASAAAYAAADHRVDGRIVEV